MNNLCEFKSFSLNGIYNIAKIESWLMKYKTEYIEVAELFNTKKFDDNFYRIKGEHQEEFKFIEVFEKLQEISECHKNEKYFKDELDIYESIKNDVVKLNSWLEHHYLDGEERQSEFRALFYDNRELTGYNFNVELLKSMKFKINIEDFKHSLRFLNLIERSKKIIITGEVTHIYNLKVFEEIKTIVGDSEVTRPAFSKQEIILSTNDEHLNEYLIRFVNGKTKLLDNLHVGKKIKIYTDLRGGKWTNGSGVKEYQNIVMGWEVEVLSN